MHINGVAPRVDMKVGGKLRWMPKPGESYVIACLIGGYYDTRIAASRELKTRFGIDCQHHFGMEKRDEPNLFIPPQVDIVLLLTGTVDKILERVLKAIAKSGKEQIGLKGHKYSAQWTDTLKNHGFESPPRWQGIDIDKLEIRAPQEAPPKAIEPPRLAWEDPALKAMRERKEAEAKEAKNAPPSAPIPLFAPQKAKPGPKPGEQPRTGRGTAKPGAWTEPQTKWGAELRGLREATGLSQGAFANKIGQGQCNVSSWERGRTIPQWNGFVKLKNEFPSLSEPPDIVGRLVYEKRHGKTVFTKPGTVLVPPPATPYGTKTAKQAFGAAKVAEPVVALPAPKGEPVAPPPAPVEPPTHTLYQLGSADAPQKDSPALSPRVIAALAPTTGDARTITLRSGGKLTVSVNVELMKLRGEDRNFVFGIIDMLSDYEEGAKK